MFIYIYINIASKGNRKVVEMLVKAGALLNRTTKDGRTALYLAVQEGKKKKERKKNRQLKTVLVVFAAYLRSH